jgi:hypothetical protein
MDTTSKYIGFVSDKMINKAIAYIEENGYMTLESINEYIKNNTHKTEFEFYETQISAMDYIYIDMRINYNLFMIKNTFYTSDTLLELHPFEQFGKQPEEILTQQAAVATESKYRTEIGMQNINAAANNIYKIIKSIPMKIYIADTEWDDFMHIVKFSNGIQQFVTPLLLKGGPTNMKFIADLFGIPHNIMEDIKKSRQMSQLEDIKIAQMEEKIEKTIKPLIADNEEKARKIKELEEKLAALTK